MSRIGIFFGPEKGSVDKVAHLLGEVLGLENGDIISVSEATPKHFESYSHIIFGISTVGKNSWDSKENGSAWDCFLPSLGSINFAGKTVAIFGLGDQLLYPGHFVDGIVWLADALGRCNVKTVGECDPEGYRFDDSEALRNGKFIGLPIDEDNEPELTKERLAAWVATLKKLGY